ncbi:enoyl-CoA hydratase-related protein [Thermodesulfobacteriota bacterium]
MSYENIIYEKEDRIGRITLNRPEKLNALSKALRLELDRALTDAEDDDSISVVIIKGAGRAFSAGYDLDPSDMQRKESFQNPVFDRKRLLESQRHWWRIWDCPKPVIAQVHGYCLAGGAELAMMCDLVLAAEDAQFGYPPLRDMGSPPTPIWPWLVGARWAKIFFFTGDTIDGRMAEAIGMINFAVPGDRLGQAVKLLAERLVKVPVDLLTLHKSQVNRAFEVMGIRAAVASGAEFDTIAHLSKGVQEGFNIPVEQKGIKWGLQRRAKLFEGNFFEMIQDLKSK